MRARNALTGRGEEAEVIGGVLFELKVAGPSMLGIGCPDRHPLPLIHSPPTAENAPASTPPSRESAFVRCPIAVKKLAAAGPTLACLANGPEASRARRG